MSQLERGERPKDDDQRPQRILTLEEMHALIAAVESLHMRCLFELMLASIRVGEALGLTVADLDTKTGSSASTANSHATAPAPP